MSTSSEVPDPAFGYRGRMFWLPPHGFGNGISAGAWAELAYLTEDEVPAVLFALTDDGIAGYVAVLNPQLHVRADDVSTTYRLWVDSLRYRHAEDVLMEVLRGRPET
jgi:hypothetical protein